MEEITIQEIENQNGILVRKEFVKIDEEHQTYEQVHLNCFSAFDLGLGNCSCNTHPTYIINPITREKAQEMLQNPKR